MQNALLLVRPPGSRSAESPSLQLGAVQTGEHPFSDALPLELRERGEDGHRVFWG